MKKIIVKDQELEVNDSLYLLIMQTLTRYRESFIITNDAAIVKDNESDLKCAEIANVIAMSTIMILNGDAEEKMPRELYNNWIKGSYSEKSTNLLNEIKIDEKKYKDVIDS